MERPNILFICTDQEQAFPQHPAEFRLPARERLRRNGLTFLNFQASTTLCTSSRSVIYSGQHAPRSGMWDNLNFSWIADLSVPTLGHMMRQMGYYTAYKGRWLLSEIPKDESSSALESYGFADYQEDGDLWGMPQEGYRRDKEVAEGVRRWLLEKAPLIEQDQPWLMAVNFLNPRDISFYDTDAEGDAHGPGALKNVSAPEDELYKFNWQPELATSFDDDLISQPEGVRFFGRFSAGVSGFIPHDRHDLWQAHLNYYLNSLRDSDQWLGVVLEALEESGQAKRTVIIFTSDHGEMGTAHGLRQTGGAAFKELVNVPFIVCHPQLPGKLTTEALGSAVDIVPTILGLSGLSQEDRRQRFPQVKGRDLSSVFSNPSGNGPRGTPAIRGDGVLYTYDMVHSLDVDWFLRHAIEISDLRYALGKPQPGPLLKDLSEIELPDLSRRRMFRGVFDGRYKLIRYFSPDNYNTPQNMGELVKYNDLALYDLVQDPDETRNLANQKDAGYDEPLLLEMNKKLNALISIELGEDISVLAPLLSKPSDPN